jgi:hypothetical protein
MKWFDDAAGKNLRLIFVRSGSIAMSLRMLSFLVSWDQKFNT